MGTRGIMGVRIDGQDKLTYNHSDSYPDGLGEAMVEDCRRLIRSETKFAEDVRALVLVDGQDEPSAEQAEKLQQYTNTGVGEPGKLEWYKVLRETQGNLGEALRAGFIIDSHEFMNKSLFCKWAYIVNLDENVFEVYRGFQQDYSKQKGRYATTPEKLMAGQVGARLLGQDVYLPVTLIASFPLTDIPRNWIKQLPKDEEDQEE